MALKVWNGSSWVEAQSLRVWNGSAWAQADTARIWNGSSWVEFITGVTPDTQTVTVGGYNDKGTSSYGYVSGAFGSISDGTSNTIGGATILELSRGQTGDFSWITFKVNGVYANEGFDTMNIDSGALILNRTDASFNENGSTTTWTWGGSYTNVFGTNGTKVVTWA